MHVCMYVYIYVSIQKLQFKIFHISLRNLSFARVRMEHQPQTFKYRY